MREFQRAHPVTILFNLGHVFFLIIIPVLRGFFSALQGGFSRWLSGAWLDILVFLLMIAIAVIAWLAVAFRFDGDRVYIRYGLINRNTTVVPWEKIITVTILESFYLRPVRAVRLRADTLGGSFKDSDFTIFLSNRQAGALLHHRRLSAGKSLGKVYQPGTASIIALSLLTSNSFGGILFISAFISQSGKLLGEWFSEMLILTFEEAARSFAFGIPPAAAAIGYILIAGWFVGFLLSFVRYKNFTLTRRVNSLGINGGIFTRRKYYIRYRDINFIDIRQSMATKLLKLQSLYISAVGYGKHKDDISCIIPSEREKLFDSRLSKIFPAMSLAPRQYMPEKRGVMRFLGAPILGLALILTALIVFTRLFPLWKGFILFAGLMAFVPALFFLFIRIFDFLTCGVSVSDGNYILRYSSGLTLHTVIIPGDKVVCVELRQGFFQKFGRYCDLIVFSKAERRSVHRCRCLVKSELEKVFGL